MAKSKMYEVLRLIWHTGKLEYFYPAKAEKPPVLVDLDHLNEKQIKRLLDKGVVKEATPKKKSEE